MQWQNGVTSVTTVTQTTSWKHLIDKEYLCKKVFSAKNWISCGVLLDQWYLKAFSLHELSQARQQAEKKGQHVSQPSASSPNSNFHILARNKICNPKLYTSGRERIKFFVFSNSAFLLFKCLNTKTHMVANSKMYKTAAENILLFPYCPSWFLVAWNPCRETAARENNVITSRIFAFCWKIPTKGFMCWMAFFSN